MAVKRRGYFLRLSSEVLPGMETVCGVCCGEDRDVCAVLEVVPPCCLDAEEIIVFFNMCNL